MAYILAGVLTGILIIIAVAVAVFLYQRRKSLNSGEKSILTLGVTNDNFHGVHRLELYIVAFKKNHCIANTGRKNINKIPLCC